MHAEHAADQEAYPRLAGWWSVPFATRFEMAPGAALAPGAAGFGCSNVNPLMAACLQQSLLVLQQAPHTYLRLISASPPPHLRPHLPPHLPRPLLPTPRAHQAGGVGATRRKSLLLTAYLELLLHHHALTAPRAEPDARRCGVQVVTPRDHSRRGCQLSLRVLAAEAGNPPPSMRELERQLRERGVSTDAREPDIVRVSPAPLFNSFADVRRFIAELQECLTALA